MAACSYPPQLYAWHLFRARWLSPPEVTPVSEEQWEAWLDELRSKCGSDLPRRFRKERERRRLLCDLRKYYAQCISPASAVCVRPATDARMGLGLFARRTLYARRTEAFGVGKRRRITQRQREALEEREGSFVCDPETGVVHIVDGPASLANHACGEGANASLELTGVAGNYVVMLKPTRNKVNAGEEIFIDYGADYWLDRKEKCVCAVCKDKADAATK